MESRKKPTIETWRNAMHVIKYNAYLGIDNSNFMNNRD